MLEDHALSIELDHRAMDTLMARTEEGQNILQRPLDQQAEQITKLSNTTDTLVTTGQVTNGAVAGLEHARTEKIAAAVTNGNEAISVKLNVFLQRLFYRMEEPGKGNVDRPTGREPSPSESQQDSFGRRSVRDAA